MKKLLIIATPIGNLGDMTPRAVEELKNCDVILAEDTRRYGHIASRFEITGKKVISLHQHTHELKIRSILERIDDGIACYVSDAGTPNIADPGGKLVKVALELEFVISALPGASALTYILSVSPWNTKEFVFVGFLPKKGTENYLKKFSGLDVPLYLFESPYRIRKTLTLLKNLFPESNLIIAREMTKIYEEIIVKKASDIAIDEIKEKGEYAVGLQLH